MSTISKLASSDYLTDKHWEWRDGSQIKYIIPHHMAGKLSGAGCARYFVNNGIDNSANYCIGYDGDIACNVPEDYGAWTSSFSLADKYAITIEVSDIAAGDWRIPSAAQEALINLMVDLFQRYPSLGGKAVYDPTDEAEVVSAKRAYRTIHPKGNILLHVWTSAYATTCPEWHMKQILPMICERVNEKLAGGGGGGGDTDTYTVRQAAQKMIDDKINGWARINWCTEHNLDSKKVQEEIDKMLGKNAVPNVQIVINHMPTLQKGSKSEIVTILQEMLYRMGYLASKPDGSFGNDTYSALIAYQKNINAVYDSDFPVDGVCGQKTWTWLMLGA